MKVEESAKDYSPSLTLNITSVNESTETIESTSPIDLVENDLMDEIIGDLQKEENQKVSDTETQKKNPPVTNGNSILSHQEFSTSMSEEIPHQVILTEAVVHESSTENGETDKNATAETNNNSASKLTKRNQSKIPSKIPSVYSKKV